MDLFAGMGGFHRALTTLGHECVYASEIDPELQELYRLNFPGTKRHVYGDIRDDTVRSKVPTHDILCAGFPCQPFSKSGFQNGTADVARGTLFDQIVAVLEQHHPPYVILENVGNFERHDAGRTWTTVRSRLTALGYDVRGTTHKATGGHGLISPHHLGFPHTRERFFIVASLASLALDPFPSRARSVPTTLRSIVETNGSLSTLDREETQLTQQQVDCINHWNEFIARIPRQIELPSFPIWGDELGATYPFAEHSPFGAECPELRRHVRPNGRSRQHMSKADLLDLLPSYARVAESTFPDWKVAFIRQNREWFKLVQPYLTERWKTRLRSFPPSLRKLEWNCKGEEKNLWRHVLQFRPSGLRAKRFTSSPALVAMTVTQIPILGPKRRFITRVEGLRLQGFPDDHRLPRSRARAFAALGNAVHVGVTKAIASSLLTCGAQSPK